MSRALRFIDNPATLPSVGMGTTMYFQPPGLTTPQVAYTFSRTVPFDQTLVGGTDFDITLTPLVVGFQGNILVLSVGE